MIKRLRDFKKYLKPLAKLSIEEWENLTERALYASKFLDENNPISNLMREELKKAEEIILQNRIHEVHEEKTITETVKKIFITPKKVQVDELVGQIKFIREFLAEAQFWVNKKAEIEKMEAEGKIVIEGRETK